jgi:hypothetical protein
MSTSKLQRYVSNQLSIHFGGYTTRENHRPGWLNSGSGGNLELDFYIEELDLAIEVQGKQHWQFVPIFHGNRDGYNAQIERDKKKKAICKNKGVKLIEVFSKNDIDQLIRGYFYTEEYDQSKPTEDAPYIPIHIEPPKPPSRPAKPKLTPEEKEKKQQETYARHKKKFEEKKKQKTIDFIKSRAADPDCFKNKRPMNNHLRKLEKYTDRAEFVKLMKSMDVPLTYLVRLFPNIEIDY